MTTSYCRHSPSLSREGNVLHAFLRANIQELTFHQTNHCSRLQTIRWFRQSDRKPVGPPFRLKNRRTFACFPFPSCQLNGLHCPGNSFGFLAVQKPIELCQLVNPHIHLRINDVNPPASYLLLTYHLFFYDMIINNSYRKN